MFKSIVTALTGIALAATIVFAGPAQASSSSAPKPTLTHAQVVKMKQRAIAAHRFGSAPTRRGLSVDPGFTHTVFYFNRSETRRIFADYWVNGSAAGIAVLCAAGGVVGVVVCGFVAHQILSEVGRAMANYAAAHNVCLVVDEGHFPSFHVNRMYLRSCSTHKTVKVIVA